MLFKHPKEKQASMPPTKKHLYLVDFENTNKDGLYGLDTLNENDHVIIFFGSHDKTVPIDCHKMIMNTKAIVNEMQMDKTDKNYLDFQLATYCGYLIGTHEYLDVTVVSKDTGFDSLVDFWRKRQVSIRRITSIIPLPKEEKKSTIQVIVQNPEPKKKEPPKVQVKVATQKATQKVTDVPESIRRKVRKAVAELKLAGQHYSVIYKSMAKATDINGYRSRIAGSGIPNQKQIYEATVAIFEEYKN